MLRSAAAVPTGSGATRGRCAVRERRSPTSLSVRAGRPSTLRVLVGVVLASTLAACGSSTPEDVIDRETFIEAYVELRVAALATDSARIAASDREAVLGELGITEDDLIEFVEVHATDLEFMRDVWNEVELRMDRPMEGVAEADEG